MKKKWTLKDKIRLSIVILLSLAYIVLLGSMTQRVGDVAFRLGMLPVLFTAFFYGRTGLWVALGITLFNTFFVLTHLNEYGGVFPVPLSIGGTIIIFLMAVLIAIPSDMHRKIKSLNIQLKELSLVDPLTKLYNRRFASEVVSSITHNFLIKKTEEDVKKRSLSLENKVMGIFILDIDHFKRINDKYGHVSGDQVLVSTSALIKKCVRFDDMVVRWGGEEFLVILVDTDPDFLPVFAQKLRIEVEKNTIPLPNDKTINITISSGCVSFPLAKFDSGITFEECINLADQALYNAKKTGRNRSFQLVLQQPASYLEITKELEAQSEGGSCAIPGKVRFQLVASTST